MPYKFPHFVATIFSMSGRNTKFDRSLFQRLEEAGHEVHMLDTQYRMHPSISDFPRRIFYDGKLLDGPNVKNPEYGGPLKKAILQKFHLFQPFTVLDLESTEERGGTSLSNTNEAQLALHLFNNLKILDTLVSETAPLRNQDLQPVNVQFILELLNKSPILICIFVIFSSSVGSNMVAP